MPTEVTPLFQDDAVCAQAPATFNPLNATADQLHYYGLPARASGESLSHYLTVLGYFKHRKCTARYVNMTGSASRSMHAASANHAADVNPVQAYPHNIWAGNIADQPTGPNTQTDHTYH
jgi:hypothetical protein